ncbi:MAG: DUF342 domain-containing protein [Betaproteobacteria bacterium]
MSLFRWLRSGRQQKTAGDQRKDLVLRPAPPDRSDYEERLGQLPGKPASGVPAREPEVDTAGTVEVTQGEVVVADPVGRGQFPTIAPGPGVVIFVNGKAIQGPTTVTSRFKVELYAPSRPPACRMAVRLSESRLEAYLTIERVKGQEFAINDAPPSPRLTVTATVVRESEPDPPTVEEVLDFLTKEGVTYGVDGGAVREVLHRGGTVTVARGDPPVPGENAHIEYCFPEAEFLPRVVGDDEPYVDLLDRNELVSVAEGTVLARKFPARPGAPGRAVTGEVIPAVPVEDVVIRVGPGVTLVEDGLVAVAAQPGRPLLKNNVLSVLPVFVVHRDADAETGHLTFNGHLLIKGNVRPGIKVHAAGDVKILGDAEQATIVAGGNVDVRGNLVGCLVRAGGLDAVGAATVLKLEELASELELLVKSVYEIKSHPSFRTVGATLDSDGPLVRLLLDKKFQGIPQLLASILDPSACPSDEELVRFLEACAQRYTGLGPVSIRSVVEVAGDVQTLCRLIDTRKASIHAPAHLYASYAQNCRLEASGQVWVIGDGCYNCELHAGQDVRIDGRRGIFRGGSITSGGHVNVRWLGSPAGSPTKIDFQPGKRVTAEQVEPNVILKAGRQAFTINDQARLMEAYIDQEGLLQVVKLRPEQLDLKRKPPIDRTGRSGSRRPRP